MVQLPTYRHAVGQTRHLHRQMRQTICDVMSRGLTVHRRIQCEDDFADISAGRARHQAGDVELVRTDAVERRQRAAHDMVSAPEDA